MFIVHLMQEALRTQNLKQSPDPRKASGHPPSSTLRRGGSKKRPKVKVETAPPRREPREGCGGGDGDGDDNIDDDNESGSDDESEEGQEEGNRRGTQPPLGSDSPNRFQQGTLSRMPSARSQQLEVRLS